MSIVFWAKASPMPVIQSSSQQNASVSPFRVLHCSVQVLVMVRYSSGWANRLIMRRLAKVQAI